LVVDKSNRWVIPILSASNFVIGMGAFMVIGIIEPFAEDLQLTSSKAGWLMTSYAIGYAILSPLLVSLTGGIGRRRVLVFGLSLFGFACLLAAVSPNEIFVFLARVLAAAGAGLVTPVGSAVAAGLSAPEKRARSLAAVFFGLTLAQIFGVPVGSYLSYTYGWRTAFYIVAILSLPCIYLLWTRIPAGLKFQATSLRELRETLSSFPIMLSVLFTAAFLGAIYIPYTFLAPLLSEYQGFGRNGIAVVLMLSGVGAVLGNLISGWFTDRVGSYKTLLFIALAQVLLMPVLSLVPVPNIVVFVFALVWAGCGWSVMAPQQSRLLSIAPDKASVVLALNAAAIYIGAAIGSALGASVLEIFSLKALGWAGSIAAFFALLHLIYSQRKSPV